jgi:D-alanyl-D-alanine carboxypeptidase (penicillin-binding protein 5/6)
MFLLASTLTETFSRAAGDAPPDISAKSAIVLHADTGRALYEKNAGARMLIASTTKILTALVVLESTLPDVAVTIKPEWTGADGSSMYLKAGEKLTVRDLLYGLMLSSGNDAAVALACSVAGDVSAFADLMNKKAQELGCQNSHFENPSGLDGENHYSCARDLALIAAAAMKIDTFAEIASTKYVTAAGRSMKNHNRLLWEYEGMLGGKTGYTKSAGRTLVTCAERDELRLICVTLSDPNDWRDQSRLYDWAFSAYSVIGITENAQRLYAEVISGTKKRVLLMAEGAREILVRDGDAVDIIPETPRFVYAPVVRGGLAGTVAVLINGELAGRYTLKYAETVRLDPGVPLTEREKLKRAWRMVNKYAPPLPLR